MSSEQKIGAPFTLASLPRPINTGTGRTQASGVCSISGTKKRKRTEIVVGVDGEGILIYSVGNSNQFFRDFGSKSSSFKTRSSLPRTPYLLRYLSKPPHIRYTGKVRQTAQHSDSLTLPSRHPQPAKKVRFCASLKKSNEMERQIRTKQPTQ
jgi:hypothetical protein